jgi:hypothetical protein
MRYTVVQRACALCRIPIWKLRPLVEILHARESVLGFVPAVDKVRWELVQTDIAALRGRKGREVPFHRTFIILTIRSTEELALTPQDMLIQDAAINRIVELANGFMPASPGLHTDPARSPQAAPLPPKGARMHRPYVDRNTRTKKAQPQQTRGMRMLAAIASDEDAPDQSRPAPPSHPHSVALLD